jgi:exopolysaccharide biosynthesis polyprenyl glycosylphosphotransferase
VPAQAQQNAADFGHFVWRDNVRVFTSPARSKKRGWPWLLPVAVAIARRRRIAASLFRISDWVRRRQSVTGVNPMLKRFLWLLDTAVLIAAFLLARKIAPAISTSVVQGGALRLGWLRWLALPVMYDQSVLDVRGQTAVLALTALPVTVLFLQMGRGYAAVAGQSRTRMVWRCSVGPTVGLAAVGLFSFALHIDETSRALEFFFWMLSIAGLLASRTLLRQVMSWRHRRGLYCKTVAVIGRRGDAQALLARLSRQISECDYKLLGYYEVLSATPTGDASSRYSRLGDTHDFAESLIHTPVKLAVAVTSDGSGEWLPEVLQTCDYFRLPVQVVPRALFQAEGALSDLRPRQSAGQLPLAAVVFEPAELDSDLAVFKRILDVAVSAAALILLTPLFLLVAMAIKLTTPDLPILYRYRQIGLHGVGFTAYKFTTMVRDAEKLKASLMALNEMQGPVFKIRNDPRITPLGKFLRVSSINELPQLFNVLRGDLSLVGPRAALPCELPGYQVWHKRKLTAKPGLTCLWQVSGRNRISSFDEWVRLDLQYIDNWSLWLDFKILARTAGVLLKGSGS